MICLKQTKVTEWIISGNPEQYNVVDAFHNLHRVDWAQKANMTAGDIVYIYVSGNVKAIKFKCRVNKADLDESDIDDREYDLSGQFDGTAGRYMELELLEEYVGDEYSREELMKHGFRSPQGPIRMPESVKQYLESISVFEHRYPVNTAVWIATALLSAESFDSNPVCSKKDMYFKQTAIIQRAQKLAESSVANARCSQWCCADNDNSSNNYLRGDSEEDSSLRRLSLLDEFPEKTHPEGLNMADELTMNGNKITMEELFYFVREQYPTIIGNDSKIDYIGVLDYLRDNTDVPYSKPDAPGLAAEEVSRLLEVKKKGQNAIAELKKMAEAFAVRFKLEKCMSMSWLDGSNTKTRRYLWAPLKYGKYADNPVSVSVFVEKRNSDTCYRVSLEIKNDGDDKDIMKQYHSHLDIPLNVAAGLVYVSVSGSNEWGTPDILNKTQDEIKQEVESGKLKKVQICKYIDRKPDETNAYYHTEITKAIAAILPYYDHVLGIEKIEYYPSLAEYDPGITAEEYERILGDENIVKSAWLDTLHYLYLMGGIGTCKQIANKYGNGAAHYNTNAINVAKAVHKETNCPLCARDTGENQYWPVLFYGRDLADSADGVFSYKMREPLMEAIKALEERGVFQEMKEANKEFDKNLILYGPPGTGKTYNSATYAVAICDGKSVDELTDYDAVMTRYNELKKAGRIAFTTFHQSYGYEEFIEGIKPIIDENKQDIGYTIESGVFKEFCEKAKSIVRTKNGDSIDAGARIWKLTIMNGDLNQVKQECFEENNVRMGFDIDSDEARSFVEDVRLGDIILSFKTRKTIDGIAIVTDEARSFVEDVRLGDIILSFKTRKTIDGIAIVTDEAAVLQDKSMYKTARAVKWLAKNIDEDITDINNGKLLHRMTFAKVPNMNVKDVIKLAEKVNPGLESTVIEENTEPHVFIIDEINRGNISKIFGELITLIESTKRAGMSESASAILPYSGDEFSVPSNVYILGTMNTADRSIALMDTALRRRFQFIEMMPDSDVLRKIHADKVEDLDVAAMLDKINERITFLYDREHTIGHAFFTGLKDDASLSKLQSIFEKSVIPLLQEYFYEDYQKIQLVLGDNAKSDDSLKFILDEKVVAKNIFKGNVEDVIDLPEKRYSINKVAFGDINSYKEIL